MHASNLFLSLVAPAVALGIALDDFANLQTLFRTTSADILDTVIFTNGTSRGYGSNATVIPYSVALSTPYDTAGAIRQCSMSIQDSEDDATSDLVSRIHWKSAFAVTYTTIL
ncbi:MAG: hypothetical protein M1828_003241 [Chrysothrix sp. TS-e1954]|nr:MAG: hypothetical protein M1828_003241 [Chrysothrix sp. TS-e1954]